MNYVEAKTITSTELHNNLRVTLKEVTAGRTILISKHGDLIAVLLPVPDDHDNSNPVTATEFRRNLAVMLRLVQRFDDSITITNWHRPVAILAPITRSACE